MMAETNERAAKGREILKSRAAQGEPGTKQPHAKDEAVKAQEVVDDLKTLREKHAAEVRGPSAGDTQNHPVPPAERTMSPITGGGIQEAAGAVAAAQAHIENDLIAEARRTSDPRYEQDQKKFEMGQRGELAFLPPPTREETENPPQTPAEQVARDEGKLQAAEATAKQMRGGQIPEPESQSVKDSQIRTGTGKPGVTGSGTDANTPATPAERASSPSTVGGLRSVESREENSGASGGGTPIK